MSRSKTSIKITGFIVAGLVRCLLFLLFSGCWAVANDGLAPYEKYVDEIVSSFAREMYKEYGLVCIGSGGRMPKDVEEIKVIFYAYRPATIEEARELYVTATERLLEQINTHEKIRPFLREYPFTLRNADEMATWCRARVLIYFHKKGTNSYYLDGSVACVAQAKGGIVYYSTAELQKRKESDIIHLDGTRTIGKVVEKAELVDILEEPLEEAVKIVHEKRAATANLAQSRKG